MPSGKVVGYGYTAHLRTSVTIDSTTLLSGAIYEPFGPTNQWTWGFGPLHQRAYDLRGLPSIIDLAGEPVTLGRDAAGQVTSATFPFSGFDLTTDYDALGRLEDFASLPAAAPLPVPDTQQFSYDPNGNRETLTENGTLFTYSNASASNRLNSTTGPVARTYGFDAAGNATSDGLHTYGYNDRGRLVSVDAGSTATYQHNGQGQRVKKDVSGTVTLIAYDEQGRVIGEYDATGNPLMEHVCFDGQPVAALKRANIYQIGTDHLGTPRVIFEGFLGVVWTWISDPFGATPAQAYTDSTGTLFTYNLRFPGQYFDAETGLHYNYYRTYDPSTGRYLESDPIGLVAGLNTYSYVSNMPTMRVDPFGLIEWHGEISGGAVAYGGGISAFEILLRSKQCVDGKIASVRIQARGPAGGAGAKWTLPFTGWTPEEFMVNDDGFDYYNFQNMEGLFIMNHVSFGVGVAAYAFNIGFGQMDIRTNSGGITGGGAGIREGTVEGGFFTTVGSANIVDIKMEACGACSAE